MSLEDGSLGGHLYKSSSRYSIQEKIRNQKNFGLGGLQKVGTFLSHDSENDLFTEKDSIESSSMFNDVGKMKVEVKIEI